MKLLQRCQASVWLILLLAVLPVGARPLPAWRQPTPTATLATMPAATAASTDTTVLLGGPGFYDGQFEDQGGLPMWHGWVATDHTAPIDTFWTVSTFNADQLGGHGPGNHAAWCGSVFAGGDEGYGNDWQQHLGWTWTVANVLAPVTVQVQARMNHDTEPGFDRVYLQAWRSTGWQTEASWEGWRIDRAIDETVTMQPGDFAGPGQDQIQIRFSFFSDETWSDEDGLYLTDGACQIDDIRVVVDSVEATFDDFEPGSDVHWFPRDFIGAGAFAQLFQDLAHLDTCRDNGTIVVAFVDDGLVVPGTGGSPCVTWCYGPGGYVVNSTGGRLGDEGAIDTGVQSPPLAWPDAHDDLLLEFDVYVHEPLVGSSPGIVYRWRVRSTADADPATLETAPWRSRDVVFHGAPEWRRHHEPCGDLLVPARRWVQIELEVLDYGNTWGLSGNDATPAPYFDNVAVKATVATGPRIVVDDSLLPQDTFPDSGELDFHALELNSCRFDMARNISPAENQRIDPGDSVVVEVHLLRAGAELVERPRLMVRLRANPLFDPFRIQAPDADGFVMLEAEGDTCRGAAGEALPGRWAFDLPDTGLIFPGDVLHYFVEIRETAGGSEALATWPADTTGFADFGTPTIWPAAAVMRALPTVMSDSVGDQPPILFWQDYPLHVPGRDLWDHALATLGLEVGVDYDHFRTRAPEAGVGNGLGARAAAAQINWYDTVLYDSGTMIRHTLARGNWQADPSPDRQLLLAWFGIPGRHGFFTGDNLAGDVTNDGLDGGVFLASLLGVEWWAGDASEMLGGQTSPEIQVLDGNSVFDSLTRWRSNGGCPQRRSFDLVLTAGNAEMLAEYTNHDGAGGVYPFAAATRNLQASPFRDVISLPYSLTAVHDLTGGSGQPDAIAARVRLLADVLTAFGQTLPAPVAVPGVLPAGLSVASYPNPFNPRTTVAFEIPTAGQVSLNVVDIRGRRVRTLIADDLPAGPGRVIWDGSDDAGRACASGIYFHVLRAAGETRLGKMTLIR